jgi:hypothetical protein
MLKRQLEFNLGHGLESRKATRRTPIRFKMQYRRQDRARQWFAHMRQVVEDTLDPRAMP